MKIKLEEDNLKQLIEDIMDNEKNVFDFDGCFCGRLEYPIGSIDGRQIYLLLEANCWKSTYCDQQFYQLKDFQYGIELAGDDLFDAKALFKLLYTMEFDTPHQLAQYGELHKESDQYVIHNFNNIISKILTDNIQLSKKQEKKIREAVYKLYCRDYCWSRDPKNFPLSVDPNFKI